MAEKINWFSLKPFLLLCIVSVGLGAMIGAGFYLVLTPLIYWFHITFIQTIEIMIVLIIAGVITGASPHIYNKYFREDGD
jgi:hypothetical protein